MALSFIGKPISLISHSDVRYRGILAGIDPQASTIQLSNVYSMGTESRRPPNQFIAPVQDPYAYIIFRASEVKDLAVDEPTTTPGPNVHDDPAVLGASAPIPKPAYPPYPAGVAAPGGATPSPSNIPPQSYPQTVQAAPAVHQQQQQQPSVPAQSQQPANRGGPTHPNTRRPNPLHSAAASLETVERALGDLRVNGGGAPTHAPRGGRRGHGGGRQGETQLKVPTTDFDFESSNAKFDKAAHSPAAATKESTEDGDTTSGSESAAAPAEEAPAYNPQKSFFDSLSSSSAAGGPQQNGGSHQSGYRGRRGGGGPGQGRNRREEEREKNVATFGEPGGVGLLGPGGYVGGWGGYGRRGGRPRRGGGGGGGGRGGANPNSTPAVQAQARV